MGLRKLLALLLVVSSTAANGQAANPFIGNWKVSFQGDTRPVEARLVIDTSGGSWKTMSSSKHNPCVGREVPIAIESSTQDAMTLMLKFAEVIPGCPDLPVKLQRVDDKTLTGVRGKNTQLALTRE